MQAEGDFTHQAENSVSEQCNLQIGGLTGFKEIKILENPNELLPIHVIALANNDGRGTIETHSTTKVFIFEATHWGDDDTLLKS